MSDQHSGRVERQAHVLPALSFRGGCQGCGWLGPHRDDPEQAQADAQQHIVDAQAYALPDVWKG